MPAVELLQLDPELPVPAYAHVGDGAVDLYAREGFVLPPNGGRFLFGTGIAIALPAGWCGLVLSRSGLAARHGVIVANAPGLIDSGYRGEIKAPLINLDPAESFTIERGDRIAQLLVLPLERIAWQQAEALGDTERGEGGFGHSGR